MALIGRFAVIVLGYAVAITAASLFLHAMVVPVLGFTTDEEQWLALGGLVVSVPFVAVVIGYFAFLPAAFAIIVSELLRWRGFLFHAFAGAMTALAAAATYRANGVLVIEGFDAAQAAPLSPAADADLTLVVLATGMVAGIAYWMLAGRGAGSWRRETDQRA
ncbi:hypothetical protein [Tianweitania sediminis]|jgi:membrane protease YdiL (CAAX protease family)|nr:hypothetical protein [Tianweitania sediminis]HEV7415177.1 hypothetical protein [Tianweitania sediminis]